MLLDVLQYAYVVTQKKIFLDIFLMLLNTPYHLFSVSLIFSYCPLVIAQKTFLDILVVFQNATQHTLPFPNHSPTSLNMFPALHDVFGVFEVFLTLLPKKIID
jgi:hypothetical protein